MNECVCSGPITLYFEWVIWNSSSLVMEEYGCKKGGEKSQYNWQSTGLPLHMTSKKLGFLNLPLLTLTKTDSVLEEKSPFLPNFSSFCYLSSLSVILSFSLYSSSSFFFFYLLFLNVQNQSRYFPFAQTCSFFSVSLGNSTSRLQSLCHSNLHFLLSTANWLLRFLNSTSAYHTV